MAEHYSGWRLAHFTILHINFTYKMQYGEREDKTFFLMNKKNILKTKHLEFRVTQEAKSKNPSKCIFKNTF